VAYLINRLALQLSIPILIVLAAYTLFKRFSAAAHLILGISLGLAPIAGVVAVLGEVTAWSLYLAAGVMFWVAGFDLLYSLQDMEFDKQHGLHSIPSKFGAVKTMWIARIFHLLTNLVMGAFVSSAGVGYLGMGCVILAGVCDV